MVMAEKRAPVGVWEEFKSDVAEMFKKDEPVQQDDKPGSELPAFGKCGCHPGGIHPEDTPLEVEQRTEELIAIPVDVRGLVNVRELPAKRSSMETFYPGTTATFLQGKDPKLKRLMLVASGANVLVGTENQIKNVGAATNQTAGFLIPTGVPIPWEGVDQDLWIMGAANNSALSVKREYWTDI